MKIYALRDDAATLARRVDDLVAVQDDGQPLVERIGIPNDIAGEIQTDLDRARMRVHLHGATWLRTSDTSAG